MPTLTGRFDRLPASFQEFIKCTFAKTGQRIPFMVSINTDMLSGEAAAQLSPILLTSHDKTTTEEEKANAIVDGLIATNEIKPVIPTEEPKNIIKFTKSYSFEPPEKTQIDETLP